MSRNCEGACACRVLAVLPHEPDGTRPSAHEALKAVDWWQLAATPSGRFQ